VALGVLEAKKGSDAADELVVARGAARSGCGASIYVSDTVIGGLNRRRRRERGWQWYRRRDRWCHFYGDLLK
jgi:hypothetical protein